MKLITEGRYAAVVSTAALVIALGGTSYAAVMITGKDIKDGTVTTQDVKNGNLKLDDFASATKNGLKGAAGPNGASGPAGVPGTPGAQGAQGVQGVPGTNGVQGLRGPSDGYNERENGSTALGAVAVQVIAITLPAGKWLVVSKVVIEHPAGGSAATTATCNLSGTLLSGDTSKVTLPDVMPSYATLTNQLGFTISTPTSVQLRCDSNGTLANATDPSMVAIQVDKRNGA